MGFFLHANQVVSVLYLALVLVLFFWFMIGVIEGVAAAQGLPIPDRLHYETGTLPATETIDTGRNQQPEQGGQV